VSGSWFHYCRRSDSRKFNEYIVEHKVSEGALFTQMHQIAFYRSLKEKAKVKLKVWKVKPAFAKEIAAESNKYRNYQLLILDRVRVSSLVLSEPLFNSKNIARSHVYFSLANLHLTSQS
jgi:hypothetical protein